ncbi:hypothetical protein FC19_GL001232 [Liquorilactobacillus aquaticus DSM 21051]|uniref:NADPH-dependent FMN reductase-like domain-containing protein n=1 Tax=Liquorilactobacillus aquaticus DSM 21051 TaxID=1423725 RepID=A0A0R2D5M1_9LACO|nr:hypothetical protein FC19_GL001232 [Liquorilactobacillus aquaticus DSM 21051]
MQQHFINDATIALAEIADIPLFSEEGLADIPESVYTLSDQLAAADGIIIATPEYDHAITAALKSTIE